MLLKQDGMDRRNIKTEQKRKRKALTYTSRLRAEKEGSADRHIKTEPGEKEALDSMDIKTEQDEKEAHVTHT